MESLTVYGFGSFFRGGPKQHDIDLLFAHRSANLESCRFAIDCKAQIKSALPSADIVMLSEAEVESLDFVTGESGEAREVERREHGRRCAGTCEPTFETLTAPRRAHSLDSSEAKIASRG